MANEQKELFLKIKSAMRKNSYALAMDLCDEYATLYPSDLNGWLYYILAYYEVQTIKDLVKVKADLKQNSVYNNALEVLSEQDGAKLIKLANDIETAVKKSGESTDYNECMQYFVKAINAVKADVDLKTQELKAKVDDDKKSFKSLNKASITMFGNNVFTFIICATLLFIPFLLCFVLFNQLELNKFVRLIPVIIYAILLVIIVFKKLRRYLTFTRIKSSMKLSSLASEDEIILLCTQLLKTTNKRKKLLMVYKALKKSKKLNAKGIAKLKLKFDNIYNL